MIYISPNNDRHPVTKTFTPLHYNVIVRYSNSLRPRPCCGLSLSTLSEATQNLPTSVPRCYKRTKDGRSSATCRSPFCPPALSTVSGNFVKGEYSQNTACVEKMIYSAIEMFRHLLAIFRFLQYCRNIVETWRLSVKAETCSFNCRIYHLFYTSCVLIILSFISYTHHGDDTNQSIVTSCLFHRTCCH
jgi:hypothetical protein